VTLKQALALASQKLAANHDIENPAFESEVLLRYLLQINRAQLFLDLEKDIPREKEILFQKWVARRLDGEPAAYIISCREFFGLEFYVDRRVLIPRPETEQIVEEAINFSKSSRVSSIADIGTGSGAIAVSLVVNIPEVTILATDISGPALEVARLNCEKHRVSQRTRLIQGDLLEALPEPVDILIANLPYVKNSDLKQIPSARYEPVTALDGGENGLQQIFRLGGQLKEKVNSGGCILLEMGMGQGPAIKEYLQQMLNKPDINIIPDLAGIDRIVKIKLPEA
jgi:release factor glutamine methyltransferase